MQQTPGNTTSDSTGAATILFQPRTNRTCRVSQVSIAMRAAAGAATCELQLNGRYVTTLVPQGDTAGEDPPVDVGPSDLLAVVWANAGAGHPAEATFFWDYV